MVLCAVFLLDLVRYLRLEVKQGAHPDPLEGIGGGDHVGYVAHKWVVCPA